jgi:hypothetical protein
MKCEVCLELLEEYLDGELSAEEHAAVGAHLMTCADCSAGFAALTAEQDLFARYDREVEVPPFLWTRIAAVSESDMKPGWQARFVGMFAMRSVTGAIAILLLAITLGALYLISRRPAAETTTAKKRIDPPLPRSGTDPIPEQRPTDKINPARDNSNAIAARPKPKARTRTTTSRATLDQSDVLSSDLGYLDMDDRDTANHIEQTQNLLRSIKNVPVPDGDEEIDVTYDKALSRRLLNENVVLRRDAEMKAKFPTKTLLADLEPFLIDIANLPDRARPEDVRVIKERVQKTEIVAALLDYQDRGANNR